jgi:hypothetical protein
MVYPPTLPPSTRTDTTVAAGNHADDHNKVVQAIQALIDVIGVDPTGSDFDTIAERLTSIDDDAGLSHPGHEMAVAAPSTDVSSATTTGPVVDLHASLAVTFTAPLSGAVWVEFYGIPGLTSTGTPELFWSVREGTSIVASQAIGNKNSNLGLGPSFARFYISGLTPGSSHTYKWAHSLNGYVTGDSSTLLSVAAVSAGQRAHMKVLEALAP